MNRLALVVLASLLLTMAPVFADPPAELDYQGKILISDIPLTGPGYFKFALADTDNTTNFWSNDGTTTGEPASGITNAVYNGVFSTVLGAAPMSVIDPDLFSLGTDVYLRVWFSDDNVTFNEMLPKQKLESAAYAINADQVDGMDAQEIIAAATNGVTLTGDISGTPGGGTTVDSLQGDALDTGAPASGEVLAWNGSAWSNAPGGISGAAASNAFVKKTGDTMTGALTINATAGLRIDSASNDVAIGSSATAATDGTAVGASADGDASGAALGMQANGQTDGAAVGFSANGANVGAAMGRFAGGQNSGAAIGYNAHGRDYGAALGRDANGINGGIAVGYMTYGDGRGIGVGYQADGANTNIAIGAGANARMGEHSIALGQNVQNSVADSARIRGTLYLDGATGIYYRTGFGGGAWLDYSAGFLTTDTNYVKKTGDTMTGALTMNVGAGNELVVSSSGNDISIGQGANGYGFGTAVGRSANGTSDGAAMGAYANGNTYGAAMGFSANGYDYSVGIGYAASASDNSVAIGAAANGGSGGAAAYNKGVAVGQGANGATFGTAVGVGANGTGDGVGIGAFANGNNYGVAMGLSANGYDYSVGIGYSAGADDGGVAIGPAANGGPGGAVAYNEGIAIGRGANGNDTNIAVGVSANSQGGSERISIGHNVVNSVDESARIRGTLYMDGGLALYGRVPFATGPWQRLVPLPDLLNVVWVATNGTPGGPGTIDRPYDTPQNGYNQAGAKYTNEPATLVIGGGTYGALTMNRGNIHVLGFSRPELASLNVNSGSAFIRGKQRVENLIVQGAAIVTADLGSDVKFHNCRFHGGLTIHGPRVEVQDCYATGNDGPAVTVGNGVSPIGEISIYNSSMFNQDGANASLLVNPFVFYFEVIGCEIVNYGPPTGGLPWAALEDRESMDLTPPQVPHLYSHNVIQGAEHGTWMGATAPAVYDPNVTNGPTICFVQNTAWGDIGMNSNRQFFANNIIYGDINNLGGGMFWGWSQWGAGAGQDAAGNTEHQFRFPGGAGSQRGFPAAWQD